MAEYRWVTGIFHYLYIYIYYNIHIYIYYNIYIREVMLLTTGFWAHFVPPNTMLSLHRILQLLHTFNDSCLIGFSWCIETLLDEKGRTFTLMSEKIACDGCSWIWVTVQKDTLWCWIMYIYIYVHISFCHNHQSADWLDILSPWLVNEPPPTYRPQEIMV